MLWVCCVVIKGSVCIYLPGLTGVHAMAARTRNTWREKKSVHWARISQDFSQAPREIVHVPLPLLGKVVGEKAWLITLQNEESYKRICSQPRSKS